MLEILRLWEHSVVILLVHQVDLLVLLLLSGHLRGSLALCQLTFGVEPNQLLRLLNGIVCVDVNLARVILQNVVELIVLILFTLGLGLVDPNERLAAHAYVLQHLACQVGHHGQLARQRVEKLQHSQDAFV